eukprot:122504_1
MFLWQKTFTNNGHWMHSLSFLCVSMAGVVTFGTIVSDDHLINEQSWSSFDLLVTEGDMNQFTWIQQRMKPHTLTLIIGHLHHLFEVIGYHLYLNIIEEIEYDIISVIGSVPCKPRPGRVLKHETC